MINYTYQAIVHIEDVYKRKEVVEYLQFKLKYEIFNITNEPILFTSRAFIKNNHWWFSDADRIIHKIIDNINCHSNIELFKGVVAINDENDFMQWFVSDIDFKGVDFILCNENVLKSQYTTFYKATLEELFQHFGEKLNK